MSKSEANSPKPVVLMHETPRQWMQRLEADVLAGTASPARLAHYLIAQSNGYFSSTDAPLDEHIQLTKTGAKT